MNYYGICDCYGLESFIPEAEAKERMFALKVRVLANRHRHAVVYKAEVPDDVAEAINKLLKDGKYEEALNILKTVPDVEIMKEVGMVKSWSMIPNPSLDPFSN